jgi:leucyl-tRNA synthetase
VDVYFGGMEHTTLHLLYSRFWNEFLFDQKLVTVSEPYVKRVPHGIVLGPDGEKMSKSRGNVVNPQDFVEKFGADATRMYEMFLGPHGETIAWNEQGILGVRRFLDRVWTWGNEVASAPHAKQKAAVESEKVDRLLHKLTKKITEDLNAFRFNTCVSAFMEFHNEAKDEFISLPGLRRFLSLMHPFAPHLAEELASRAGVKRSLQLEPWPEFDPAKVADAIVTAVGAVTVMTMRLPLLQCR